MCKAANFKYLVESESKDACKHAKILIKHRLKLAYAGVVEDIDERSFFVVLKRRLKTSTLLAYLGTLPNQATITVKVVKPHITQEELDKFQQVLELYRPQKVIKYYIIKTMFLLFNNCVLLTDRYHCVH